MRFLLRAERTGPLNVTEESLALRWVPLGGGEDLTDEVSITRMVEKVLAWSAHDDG